MTFKLINGPDISLPDLEYNTWRTLNSRLINTVEDNLERVLKDLDCTIELSYGRPIMTTSFRYRELLSEYYYFLNKTDNIFEYIKYFDKLADRHNANVDFEEKNPYIPPQDKKNEIVKRGKSKKKPLWIRQTTNDLFTNEVVYMYQNLKTNEIVRSSNPNLLQELNALKKRKSKTKVISVPLSSMTFSFKKK